MSGLLVSVNGMLLFFLEGFFTEYLFYETEIATMTLQPNITVSIKILSSQIAGEKWHDATLDDNLFPMNTNNQEEVAKRVYFDFILFLLFVNDVQWEQSYSIFL